MNSRMIYKAECQECGVRTKNWLTKEDAVDEMRKHYVREHTSGEERQRNRSAYERKMRAGAASEKQFNDRVMERD